MEPHGDYKFTNIRYRVGDKVRYSSRAKKGPSVKDADLPIGAIGVILSKEQCGKGPCYSIKWGNSFDLTHIGFCDHELDPYGIDSNEDAVVLLRKEVGYAIPT